MKKLGLALGAGGSRGVAHIGFLKALEENGIKPDYIAGSSMGAIVGGCYAMGMNPSDMYEEITKLKPTDIFDISFNPFGSGSILRSKKMRKKLATYFEEKTFNDLEIPFKAVAVNINNGGVVAFSGETSVCDAVTASASVPLIFQPVEIDGQDYLDGGSRCRVPIEVVKEMGADVVVGVDVLGDLVVEDKKHHLLGIVFRTFAIVDDELTKISVKKHKPNLFIVPDMGNMPQFKFKDLDVAYDAGYKAGKKYAKKIKHLLNK